ncbi:hypothetical protein SCUCBS95973_007894 [Sporothrix curviconia]|uniref:Ribosome biogenesis protein SLX9 n=1 Tax=Sporothrix curviconia TaxID=1260050 RepID=A0ABP0CH31_9PEZI
MAPVAPTPKMSHRAKALARIADPTLPRKVHREDNTVTDSFLHSKRDKQLIRKASFRAQVVEKAGVQKKQPKRRRPSKKLVATLESLADALPDVSSSSFSSSGPQPFDAETEWKGIKRRQSIKTRPGSLKRKEKVVQAEMARFGQNLAQLTAVKEETVVAAPVAAEMEVEGDAGKEQETTQTQTPAAPRQSTANRFALLRNYITMTMEQSPAFAKQE